MMWINVVPPTVPSISKYKIIIIIIIIIIIFNFLR